jgi:radical SAM superfamily enzyme YgiQ (UPF0313 family)
MLKKRKIKRVMLMYPNQLWHKYDLTTTWNLSPYILCMLGTMIQETYEVKIIDAQFYKLSEEDFRKEVENFKPDCVGISVLTSEYSSILDTAARIVKSVDRDIVTIAGGVHVTTQYFKVMENKDIDYAVRGEAERVFPEFLGFLNEENPFPVKGMVFRNSEGKVTALPAEIIEDLDSLPMPNYELVDYAAYANTGPRYGVDSIPVYPHARMLTSRGCPVGCSFCQVSSISGSKWRPRSAAKVVEELEYLIKRYGIKAFLFEDDMPFGEKGRTKELLRLMIEKKLNLRWKAAGVAIFKMDEEIFSLMAQSGCISIGIAIESGTDRILKQVIEKPVNLKKIPEMIDLAHKYGIFIAANFIIGFPGETWDEIRQTLRYAETCGADYVKIYPANPLVGTRMFEMAKEMNAIEGDENAVGWRFGRIKSTEFSSKDISILRTYEWDRINFSDADKRKKTAEIMGVSPEELETIRKSTRDTLQFL